MTRDSFLPPRSALGLWLVLSLMAGCSGREAPRDSAAAQPKTNEPVARPSVELHAFDRPGLDALLVHHPGKVVLIDYWATYCEPCRKSFPRTVELAKQYAEKGLLVLSLSCDDPEKLDEARAFLEEQQAPFQHLRSAHGSAEQTFVDFEIDGGALPHYKLYDRKGTLRHTFSSGSDEPFTFDDVAEAVERLLEETV